jgi:hypothetical protein
MSLDEFVNTVGYYMNNPGVEPAFLVVSDENLRKMGVTPPSAEAIEDNVRESVAAIKAGQTARSGFEDSPRKKPAGVDLASQGGEAAPTKSDPGLEDALKKARTSLKP